MPSRIIQGLAAIADQYDAFIIDLWGVIHNGQAPYDQALETLRKLKDLNRITLLLSNSPRRVVASIAHLGSMGLSRNFYTHIHTSGENTHQALENYSRQGFHDLGNRLYHLGPALHQGIYNGLPYEKVEYIEEADFILVTGVESPCLEDYDPLLKKALGRNLPMICANPDRLVVYGEQTVLCCGAIAEKYEQSGGAVHYCGKPDPSIYRPVLSILKDIPLNRILAVGDSLATDVQGARRMGIDSVLVMGGIYHENLLEEGRVTPQTPALLQNLVATTNLVPHYALARLCWE